MFEEQYVQRRSTPFLVLFTQNQIKLIPAHLLNTYIISSTTAPPPPNNFPNSSEQLLLLARAHQINSITFLSPLFLSSPPSPPSPFAPIPQECSSADLSIRVRACQGVPLGQADHRAKQTNVQLHSLKPLQVHILLPMSSQSSSPRGTSPTFIWKSYLTQKLLRNPIPIFNNAVHSLYLSYMDNVNFLTNPKCPLDIWGWSENNIQYDHLKGQKFTQSKK